MLLRLHVFCVCAFHVLSVTQQCCEVSENSIFQRGGGGGGDVCHGEGRLPKIILFKSLGNWLLVWVRRIRRRGKQQRGSFLAPGPFPEGDLLKEREIDALRHYAQKAIAEQENKIKTAQHSYSFTFAQDQRKIAAPPHHTHGVLHPLFPPKLFLPFTLLNRFHVLTPQQPSLAPITHQTAALSSTTTNGPSAGTPLHAGGFNISRLSSHHRSSSSFSFRRMVLTASFPSSSIWGTANSRYSRISTGGCFTPRL